MKGYHKPIVLDDYAPVVELTLIGCMRCRNTWRENYTFHGTTRVNGPMYIYDYCDNCITPEEKETTYV